METIGSRQEEEEIATKYLQSPYQRDRLLGNTVDRRALTVLLIGVLIIVSIFTISNPI